jgi:hypothetical protein
VKAFTHKMSTKAVIGLSLAALLAGCATRPAGPTVAVMPAPNKPFEVFEQDQAICRQYADGQIAGGAEAANNQAFGTAFLTTILGAGLGAAVGGGSGAAIGAASGAVAGTAMGANNSGWNGYGLQQQYDMAYTQCMYAKGNQIPGYGYGGGYYGGPNNSYGSYPPPPPPPPPASGG